MWLAEAGSSTLTGYDRQCRSYDASSFVPFGPSFARLVFRCPLPRCGRQPPLHWGFALRAMCCNFSAPSVGQPLLVRIAFLSQLRAVFEMLVTACRWPRRRLEVKTCRCYVVSSTSLAARALGLLSALTTVCIDAGARRWAACLGWRATRGGCLQGLFAAVLRRRQPPTGNPKRRVTTRVRTARCDCPRLRLCPGGKRLWVGTSWPP